MGFNCSIIGLPNIGKSTLFNALTTSQAAEAANFPFCTKEPNIGRVAVPDERLNHIATISRSEKQTPTQIEFVDTAGLIKGASQGEGLGNRFLAAIRELEATIHIVRCFKDNTVIHVSGTIDALHDVEVVETELMLADLQSIEQRLAKLNKRTLHKDEEKIQASLLERAHQRLSQGYHARTALLSPHERKTFKNLQLLTAKPMLYVCNVLESEIVSGNFWTEKIAAKAEQQDTTSVILCAQLEQEIAQLDNKKEFLASFGLVQTGIQQLIHQSYKLLDLITFFTSGPKETRAWTIARHTTALQAAGVIHGDFQRGFICAETIDYETYASLGSQEACRAAGKIRQEGKNYTVQDGDILHFRFNV